MREKVMLLNSVPMLWISGSFMCISFIFEYILPLVEIEYSFFINPAWISFLISGIPLIYLAVEDILEKRITSPILITIAMFAAIFIGDIFAAGEIAFIMAIGEFLEDKTVEKAKQGIEKLLNLVPSQGRVLLSTGEKMMDAKDLKEGDIIRVLAGESFPTDAVMIEGETSVDQSILTGESLPVDKVVGDEVFAGTINQFGTVDLKITKSFQNSSLQKMIQLVESSENQKAPTQKTVDKWASYLVPTACVIAVITYIVFAFILHRPEDAILRAVTVLVVFCPCALALATPTSIMAAIGQATKEGVLIKSGEALEQMGTVSTICFDKTGTLTNGLLMVSDITAFGVEKSTLLSMLVSIESRSEHPIGKAVASYGTAHKIPIQGVSGFQMIVGKGVLGEIDGKTIYCGNEKMVMDYIKQGITKELTDILSVFREQGKAIILVCDNDTVLGVVGLVDEIKTSSSTALLTLKKIGIEKTLLLTGDNEKSAKFIADKVGIHHVKASLLPEEKVAEISTLMKDGEQVCMVGDGVNDAPALKIASVGIAMGTMGSDIAIDAADIAILGDDITKIAYIKKLSNATLFSIKFNITLAMVINILAIILSILGLLTPATGALVHNVGSVLVVLNAAKLYDKKIDED